MNFSEYVEGNALGLSFPAINIDKLVAFLQSNTYITELSLPHCGIGDKGIEALVNGSFKNLTKLCLRANNIGDVGAMALANFNSRNLTELDLSYNQISDEGAMALAGSDFTNLTKLTLGGNDFGKRSEEALKHSLGSSASLDLLCLSAIDMGAKICYATKDLKEVIARELRFVQPTNQQQESTIDKITLDLLLKSFSKMSNIQATNDQHQRSSAQATNDSNVPRSESSSLSCPGGSNNDQPGPSSSLSEVLPISRSQSPDFLDSLDSLRSDNNDQPASELDEVQQISRSQSPDFFDSIEVVSNSQCR